MTPHSIDTSSREERQAYIREKWECMHNCEPMEQREQSVNSFTLYRVVTEEDEVNSAVSATSSKDVMQKFSMLIILKERGHTWKLR